MHPLIHLYTRGMGRRVLSGPTEYEKAGAPKDARLRFLSVALNYLKKPS